MCMHSYIFFVLGGYSYLYLVVFIFRLPLDFLFTSNMMLIMLLMISHAFIYLCLPNLMMSLDFAGQKLELE